MKEVSEIHASYMVYKARAQELEQRIDQHRKDAEKATTAERNAKKDVKKMTFAQDEICEKLKYLEAKYHALVKRMGARQQDIDHIEEEIMFRNPNSKKESFKRSAQDSYNYNRKSRVSGPEANKPHKHQVASAEYDEEVDGSREDIDPHSIRDERDSQV
jgi:chromosome segregation ATPase